MRGILPDHDTEGHSKILLYVWQSPEWRDVWESLKIPVLQFEELGLRHDDSDARVWQVAQRAQVCLVTGNRNKKGSDSLEEAIRISNDSASWPVFTLADPGRLVRDRDYAERAAVKLLEFLMEIDNVRGTGRLFIP